MLPSQTVKRAKSARVDKRHITHCRASVRIAPAVLALYCRASQRNRLLTRLALCSPVSLLFRAGVLRSSRSRMPVKPAERFGKGCPSALKLKTAFDHRVNVARMPFQREGQAFDRQKFFAHWQRMLVENPIVLQRCTVQRKPEGCERGCRMVQIVLRHFRSKKPSPNTKDGFS